MKSNVSLKLNGLMSISVDGILIVYFMKMLIGGYLSISHMCHTRLRRKFDNDNYLNFLAFVRINTDLSSDAAAARRIVNQQENTNQQRFKTLERSQNRSSKLISDYRHRFRFSLFPTATTTTTTTTTTTPPLVLLLQPLPPPFRPMRRKPLSMLTDTI